MEYGSFVSHCRRLRRQQGMSLLITMVFSLVIALIALTSMSGSIIQERMSGNMQDLSVAQQAAEMALRDAEWDVSQNIGPGTPFSDDCSDGLCTSSTSRDVPGNSPVWETVDWTDARQTRFFGSKTGAAALPGLAFQPRYIIEKLSLVEPKEGESIVLGSGSSAIALTYRITVRAVGARPETEVMLQSIYSKP